MESRAVAFTHLSLMEIKDFEDANKNGKLSKLIWNRWGRVLKAFADCSEVHLVYLFLAEAYIAHITKSEDWQDLKDLEIAIEEKLKPAIEEHCGSQYVEKFEVVGVTQLQPLLEKFMKLSQNLKGIELNQLVLGGGSELFYDCPKVAEAIIRIARRHNPESILRFDQDVEINQEGIKALLNTYNNYINYGKKYSFFSGSYHEHDQSREPDLFWLNDFAVRTHFLSTSLDGKTVDDFDQSADPNTRFHLDIELAENFIDSIRYIGGNAYNQPISGAGLCISPMAIVQLPPFANVGKNIVWIDDSIKRALHEGIGDIELHDIREVPGARFLQDRYDGPIIKLKDVRWGYNKYLPRLVHGCLMHSVMVDIASITPEGSYSQCFCEYMSSHIKPTKKDRERWKEVILGRLEAILKSWKGEPYSNRPAGKKLANFAENALDINKNTEACTKVINFIVESPLDKTISDLCAENNLESEKNAAWFVGEVIADLERYIALMDIWPYIIRTIDFEVRKTPEKLSWLIRT